MKHLEKLLTVTLLLTLLLTLLAIPYLVVKGSTNVNVGIVKIVTNK